MKNTTILEMLNKGEIEALKQKISDEIYAEGLKSKSGARERYKAMKRFVKYNTVGKTGLKKPKLTENTAYFTDGHCIISTMEGIGNITAWTEADGKFLDKVERFFDIPRGAEEVTVDFRDAAARFKAEGYKFTKARIDEWNSAHTDYTYKIRNTYFNYALIDYAYSIIDDGAEATVYCTEEARSGILIKTSIGAAYILPIKVGDGGEKGLPCLIKHESAA